MYTIGLSKNMAAIYKLLVQHALTVCCSIVCNTCKLNNCVLVNCNNCMLKCKCFLMFNLHSQILSVQCMLMCMHMHSNNYWYQNAYAAVCMHMMCACMCKLHVLFQCVLVCITHQWHKIVWQINQNVLLQYPCSTTHV